MHPRQLPVFLEWPVPQEEEWALNVLSQRNVQLIYECSGTTRDYTTRSTPRLSHDKHKGVLGHTVCSTLSNSPYRFNKSWRTCPCRIQEKGCRLACKQERKSKKHHGANHGTTIGVNSSQNANANAIARRQVTCESRNVHESPQSSHRIA